MEQAVLSHYCVLGEGAHGVPGGGYFDEHGVGHFRLNLLEAPFVAHGKVGWFLGDRLPKPTPLLHPLLGHPTHPIKLKRY